MQKVVSLLPDGSRFCTKNASGPNMEVAICEELVIISRDTKEHGLIEEKLKSEYSESLHSGN